MGAWVGKFAELTLYGAWFVLLFTAVLLSWPLLPDAVEWVRTGVGQVVPIVVTDFIAALWREPVMQSLMITLGTTALFAVLIVLGVGFAGSLRMTWWEITIFKRALGEHPKLLDGYVQQNMPHLQDDYKILADRKQKISLYNWKRNRALRLAYHRVAGAFDSEVARKDCINDLPRYARMLRTLTPVTYMTVVLAVLLHAVAFWIGKEPNGWTYFWTVFFWGVIATDIMGRLMRGTLMRLWRSRFTALYVLYERRRRDAPRSRPSGPA